MYWCALIRILFVQQSQTFQSTFLVFIIVVRLHSDAYLRSSTLSHKMGVAKLCGFRLFWPKLCGFGVFLVSLNTLNPNHRYTDIGLFIHTASWQWKPVLIWLFLPNKAFFAKVPLLASSARVLYCLWYHTLNIKRHISARKICRSNALVKSAINN